MEETIKFSELRNYNDTNSFAWTSLRFEPTKMAQIEKWFKEMGFLPSEAKLLTMRKIITNVLGDKGRTDIFFTTTPTHLHPIIRLQIHGLIWTSDFIRNYREEYK
jgi:hypothetical protein